MVCEEARGLDRRGWSKVNPLAEITLGMGVKPNPTPPHHDRKPGWAFTGEFRSYRKMTESSVVVTWKGDWLGILSSHRWWFGSHLSEAVGAYVK